VVGLPSDSGFWTGGWVRRDKGVSLAGHSFCGATVVRVSGGTCPFI
jgi:hypothetical protein